jgi:hypothetical protein
VKEYDDLIADLREDEDVREWAKERESQNAA